MKLMNKLVKPGPLLSNSRNIQLQKFKISASLAWKIFDGKVTISCALSRGAMLHNTTIQSSAYNPVNWIAV